MAGIICDIIMKKNIENFETISDRKNVVSFCLHEHSKLPKQPSPLP